MTALSGKVQCPDGVSKVFYFNDVQDAVLELKKRLSFYCKRKLLSAAMGDINALINEVFSDVTSCPVSDGFKDYVNGGDMIRE